MYAIKLPDPKEIGFTWVCVSKMSHIKNPWANIKEWLHNNAPFLITTLNPGATPIQIKCFEQKFGFSFPDTYKALLSISNGQKSPRRDHSRNIGYFYGQNFLSLEDSFRIWDSLENSPDPDVQYTFKKSFIPLAGTIDPIIVIDANSEQIYEVFVLAPDWTMPAEWQLFHRIRFQSLFEYLKWILNQLRVQDEYEWDNKDQCWYFVKTDLETE